MMQNPVYAQPASMALYTERLLQPERYPVTFTYAGQTYTGFPQSVFAVSAQETSESKTKREDRFVLSGPQNLSVTLEAAYWIDYGVSEYTVWFANRSDAPTAKLCDVYCCDLVVEGEQPVLRGILGDHQNAYRPYVRNLLEAPVSFESLSGRPTHVNFPYFNLECGNGGYMLALGWAGSWSADFRSNGAQTHILGRSTVGMSLELLPGEEIRTALTLIAPYYVRDEAYATNFWRRWFLDCNLPRANATGDPVQPFSTCSLAGDTGLPNSDGSISERYFTWRPSLEKMFEEDAKVDFRWLDAGWYSDPEGNTVPTDWWGTVGSWELDPEKWPGDTLLESVEFAHANDMKTLMWFEPERVTNPEALAKNYSYNPDWAIQIPGEATITNNLGNPDCLRWTTERIGKVLQKNRIDMYREDNNSNPGVLWRYLDEQSGRIGITECRAVMAHYKLWDDLIEMTKQNGGCAFCDSCASGGGRNDLESLRRGIPLLRSDADRTTTSLRLSMTSSFNAWVPVCGALTKEKEEQLSPIGRSDVYTWRASYLPVLNVDSQFVQDPDQDFDMLRFGLHEWKRIRSYLLKDFYRLTPWHAEGETDDFTALAYFDPETRTGIALVFRMESCEKDTFLLQLPFLPEGASCTLTDVDTGETFAYTDALPLTLAEKRMAKLYEIRL